MDWHRDLPGWPNATYSRQIDCRPHRWHVQDAGEGDLILLLHGAGGATHSWRDVLPRLAEAHRVVALDLPGHGFTRMGTRARSGLWSMRDDIATLCAAENWQPTMIVGHSAGAALGLALAHHLETPRVVGLNAALGNFRGVAGWLFPVLAKMLALNPAVPVLFARSVGRPSRVRQLIDGTGSHIDEIGLACYAKLVSDRHHVDGTLAMMAAWSLDQLLRDLPRIASKTLLITGDLDRAVPPDTSSNAAGRLPDATHVTLPNLGHLAHEEAPDQIVSMILDWSADR